MNVYKKKHNAVVLFDKIRCALRAPIFVFLRFTLPQKIIIHFYFI